MQIAQTLTGRLKEWVGQEENQPPFILAFSCVVGILAGFGAFLLKRMIAWTHAGLNAALHLSIHQWWLVILPLVGILIAVAYQKWIAKGNMVHSTARILEYVNSKNYAIPRGMMINPIVACAVTLGFGGSAGSEGPIAYAGAAVGSNLGRTLGLNDDMLRIMIGIGAGAGIAGIFKSPIAGMLFTLEVLRMNLGAIPVTGLVASCVLASITCYACTGTSLYLPFTETADNSLHFGWVCGVGVFCGIYSIIYNSITKWMQKFFDTRKRKWVNWLSSGIIVGIILWMFPSIYGEGYPVMTKFINGDYSDVMTTGLMATGTADMTKFLIVLAAMLVLKALATVCTNSGGGVAGSFAPTLFVGAVAGTLFALLVKAIFGIELSVPLCALFGMSACFAGIIHAPVMAFFLVVEMTGTFQLMFPTFVCAVVSYATVKLITPASRYVESGLDDFSSLFTSKKTNQKS